MTGTPTSNAYAESLGYRCELRDAPPLRVTSAYNGSKVMVAICGCGAVIDRTLEALHEHARACPDTDL